MKKDYYQDLVGFVDKNGVYNGQSSAYKEAFKKVGLSFLKSVLRELNDIVTADKKQKKVSYNAGGIGVSGDCSLMAMNKELNKGIHMFFNADMAKPIKVCYRNIKSMKDYSGDTNNYFQIGNDVDKLIVQLRKMLS